MTNRIVAITGGAGALGGELARTLVGRGYKVALFDTERSKERQARLVGELGAGNAIGFSGAFADEASWRDAIASTTSTFGSAPTHAVLVAGAWAGGAPVHETKDGTEIERLLDSNVSTAYRALRALLPAMVSQKHGSIVVVGSRAAVRPWTSSGAAAYAAAKGAVVTLAQAVAEEVLEHGVRVNAVLPSTMDTPVNRGAMPDADPARWVSLASAAGVIAFLLSEDARDVSGAAIPVYGRS